MKIAHLSDLHIGKKVNEFSMLSDQLYIFDKILSAIKKEDVSVVLISGDVYDKSIPTVEAVEVFDGFLTEITLMNIPVLIISGNHDSPERLGFGSKIMQNNGVHIYSVFDGTVHTKKIDDVRFHMLPFLKPPIVRKFYPEVTTYNDAFSTVIRENAIDKAEKNIILAHQFVTAIGEETYQSDSETISVGGIDNIDADIFDAFDYTALGHIHRPQSLRENIRYCGSPLKYSFSEANYDKSLTIIDSDDFSVKKLQLVPRHDMRCIKGSMEQIFSKEIRESEDRYDYLHITLTDNDSVIDAMEKVRNVYPNVMQLEFEKHIQNETGVFEAKGLDVKNPMELFGEFYELQNGEPLNERETEIVRKYMNEISGGEEE